LNIESDYIECKASVGSSITIKGMALNTGEYYGFDRTYYGKCTGSSGATISVHQL
jgi:hypothetical protein